MRRSGRPVAKEVLTPDYWTIDPGFSPYAARKRARRIAYAIDKSLRSGSYTPRPSIAYQVPKADGTLRTVSVFQVADNAVSRVTFRTLIRKNASRFSSRCYAYRPDITIHDAIHYLSRSLRHSAKVFVAEFDFSKFFDHLSHEYIVSILNSGQFILTKREREILLAFLQTPTLRVDNYVSSTSETRGCGIPQGTSVSLFLANAAASRLDTQLEGIGVRFARYADDTIIWSHDYTEVCRAVEILNSAAQKMGVDINNRKSPGIRILRSPDEHDAELRSTPHVEFLGYKISKNNISIKDSKIADVKSRMSKIIYTNLLESLKAGNVVRNRLGTSPDPDYVTAIYQLRRYLYGDLTERRLLRHLSRTTPRLHYKGLMSFYPLINDDELLVNLDGWLTHTLFTSLRARANLLLQSTGHHITGAPYGLAKGDLVRLRVGSIDLTIPSFVRIGNLMRRASAVHGPNAVANVLSIHYYSR
nr:reverse transcriptase domain-containing protein [Plesiocystis pacifica]